ncbi:hypothetical protein RAC89_24865 [Paenibacillus sp. GD4]|uniref:hypothetical protein n=1 Tax=Paenibacillus sp. GD4 TaxID=3068890 RepID=UPI002796E056|nr:hypothetical protein [Paenibacillus sp. GD4]MDQ1913637.1 hypothetical protein [Paenibacillus sp. GD4]
MEMIHLAVQQDAALRIEYGVGLLTAALREKGLAFQVDEPWTADTYRDRKGWKIYIANRTESDLIRTLEEQEVLCYHTRAPEGEGYYLASLPGQLLVVCGGSDSGTLYGCLELADLIRREGRFPLDLAYSDAPSFALRGPAIGLQKTKVEPPRRTYEYPVTPDRFPWFYDRSLWEDFLNMLLEQRCNVIYLWTGHPFSSFVKLDEYPEALEVTEEEFRLNVETFRWVTEEANKRGIWIVLNFYNIHIPLPFAQKHGLDLHQPKPLPLTADYYRKSIAAFVRSFPNVGLMVCLGEALQGHVYGVEWFTQTILPGVNEGLKELNLKEKPPIILRSHAIPAEQVMAESLPLYPNLYTEAKYNGESLTTYTPRGRWQQIHRHLSSLDSIHIINVHILANLEPFRFGAPSFIHKCMQAAKYRLGANGIHLYPLFFWDWPYSPDKTSPRLRQIDRDWLWYAAWFRYAWSPVRDPKLERLYWIGVLAQRYEDREAAEAILEAYEATGQCAPKLLRRFGITEGNRQTMSLGMTMSQLTNPERYLPWKELWECQSAQGERLEEYVLRELSGQPHVGETPMDIVEEVERHAVHASNSIKKALERVSRQREEVERLASDIEAIRLMVFSYTKKILAAIQVLTYKHTVNGQFLSGVDLLEEAVAFLNESLASYRELAELTDGTYLYANSMQTPQRKVPFPNGETFGHWRDCLPYYEAEYRNLAENVRQLKQGMLPQAVQDFEEITPYAPAPFLLHTQGAEAYRVEKRATVFTDGDLFITNHAEEIEGLIGVRFSQKAAAGEGISLDIEFQVPSRILIGYFNSPDSQWLKVPDLETNTHADDRGGLSPILTNGVQVYAYPSVNIHALQYEPGRHTLVLGKGAYVVLGVITADQMLRPRTVGNHHVSLETLDWLYEPQKNHSKAEVIS